MLRIGEGLNQSDAKVGESNSRSTCFRSFSLPRFRGHLHEWECSQGECFMDNASQRAKRSRRCFIAQI